MIFSWMTRLAPSARSPLVLRMVSSIPADLGGLHLHLRTLGQVHDGGGVHHLLAAAVALAVVLFHVAQLGVFGQIEGVDAVVLGVAARRSCGCRSRR